MTLSARSSGDRRILPRETRGRRQGEAPLAEAGFPPDATHTGSAANRGLRTYMLSVVALLLLLMGVVIAANRTLNPYVYGRTGVAVIAEAFVAGQDFAVRDVNVNIRGLRAEHLARMTSTSDLVILGASHWQEASAALFPDFRYYNAHVHRDYFEDNLAVVEMLLTDERLPETVVISVRDMTFSALSARGDNWWRAAAGEYAAMAGRLEVPVRPWHQRQPYSKWRDQISLSALRAQLTTAFGAAARPRPTTAPAHASLDILRRDGLIAWSLDHLRLFTPERTREEAARFLADRRDQPGSIDPAAVEAFGRLLALLQERGIRVVLVHPPFNPYVYDGAAGTAFASALREVEATTRRLAAVHGIEVVGSFNPHVVGCTSDMFIDAEHASEACLGNVARQIIEVVRRGQGAPATTRAPEISFDAIRGLDRPASDMPTGG